MLTLNKYLFLILTYFLFETTLGICSNPISINPIPVIAQFPSNSVQRIFQDKDGYMWFGTLDGLCRYDAYRLLTFRSNLNNPNLLTNNEITCISEDKNNNLWVGTREGLNILNRETFKITHLADPNIRRQHIRSILTASDGTIWVGLGNGIYRYDSDYNILKVYPTGTKESSLPNNGINSISEDSDGNIWVLLWRGGLHKYNKTDDTFIHFPSIGTIDNPFRIFQDNHKQYWICTWGDGIFRFDPNKIGQNMYSSLEIYNKERQQPEDTFFSIVQDNSNGYIWAMSFSGLYALEYSNDGSVKQADISYLFKETNNIFSEIIKDRSGNLWIGAFSEGALTINFNKPEIQNYPLKAITNKVRVVPNITCIYEDKDGVMWMNQNRLGLNLYYPQKGDVKLAADLPALRNIQGLRNAAAIKGFSFTDNVWVGLENEPVIYVLNRKEESISIVDQIDLTLYQSNPGTPRIFFEDRNRNIWVVTTSGIFIKPYNQAELKHISSSLGAITAITEDKDGSIWVSSENSGIYEITSDSRDNFNKWNIKNYTEKTDNLISDNIQSLSADNQNKIWIGTKEGNIVLYDKTLKVFQDYTESCGMFGEAILDIVTDSFNRIWISTNKRITEYNPENGASRDYTVSDGLLVNSFLKGSYFKNSSNKIYFGGNRGISSFTSSEKLSGNPKPSKVLITDVKIQNQSILQGFSGSQFNTISQTLTIYPDDRNIEIDFSSLNYTFPGKIQYAYKLEGVDDDWVYTSSNRQFATYNQLAKGSYTFYVKATDENRLWSSEVTQFRIQKLPAFYETWWAYLIYSTLFLICLYSALRIVQNRLKLRNELKIAQIEKEKSEELTQTKLRYFTNISHDFLTPLTIISCLIDDIESSSKKQLPQYGIMRSNVNRLKRLLQQVLDFRKVESGNMKLKITHGEIVAFIQDVCYTHFSPLIQKKKINFTFAAESKQIQAYFDADKIDKVVFNLLSNACKYTPQGGDIKVHLQSYEKKNHTYLTIKIGDSGVGIAPEDLSSVFTRFYYNSKTDASETNGIGLSLTKDLIELHHGIISAESKLNIGTTFIITIPIDKESFMDSELVKSPQILINEENTTQSSMEEEEWADTYPKNEKGNVNLLLVEDNEDLLHTMQKILSGRYNVLSSSNGAEAMEILKTASIDIIISDVMMPEMDGLELCRTLKSNIETSHISIILLTAKNSADDRIECYNAGADGYISKPFDLKVLEARINNFISNKKDKQQEFKSNVEINISTLEYPSLDEQFLNNAIEIIEKYLAETEFDINTFAEHLNMSKSSLYRKIKTMTGLSPIEFIRNIRLKHACQMLKDKSISISEVAYSVGFSDPKYFTSCFKTEFNITPSEYQKG
ncbi:two component regulator with propeller domain [Dysgonomonas alginatilytica]|uniref:histidine kinase n=1 Tax=Dysgonomonas alginatilytica TaxID=1605892 RepID=A0A2V3PRE5_9BACT|nr:hybrid sensor histidine kinase/response regulator transcription factor [Dysgonomonas alginatilytica]PXV60185.1 two component regulator with propeller domain [Dysgonomonas alginatilytica]